MLNQIISKISDFINSVKVLLSGNYADKVYLGKDVQFFNLQNIQMGSKLHLEDYVYINALSQHPLTFGENVKIGAYSRVIGSTSFDNIGEYIRIGNNVEIGEFSYLGGDGGLEIGDDCIIGQYFSCHSQSFDLTEKSKLTRTKGLSRKGIRIGKNCWIGSKVTILDGVEIGDNCVIAAGAVVDKSMPSNSVIEGVPARLIKSPQPQKESIFKNAVLFMN